MAEFRFLYQPVDDLDAAVRFYEGVLDFELAWTDDDLSVGLWMPGRTGQVMLSRSGKPAGPMYLVDDVDGWLHAHRDIEVMVERGPAGSRSTVGFRDPSGNVFYIFDQPGLSG